jgi:hypothetical protein
MRRPRPFWHGARGCPVIRHQRRRATQTPNKNARKSERKGASNVIFRNCSETVAVAGLALIVLAELGILAEEFP